MTTLVTAPHRKHRGRKNCIVHSNPSNTSQWRIAMKNRICYHQIHRHIRKPLLLCLIFILRFVILNHYHLKTILNFHIAYGEKVLKVIWKKNNFIFYITVTYKNHTWKCRKYCPELEILLHSWETYLTA